MKARYLNQPQEAEINITPMLDVVFIMLIFFIVTTSFSKETGLRLFNASSAINESNRVKVANIKLDVNEYFTVNGIATQLNGIESLLANLKASNSNIKVQLFSAKDVKTGDLVQAIQSIKANHIESYSVSSF